MRELGIDLAGGAARIASSRRCRMGGRRRHDGLRRCLPVHPWQALHRLGTDRPAGTSAGRGAPIRDEIAERARALAAELD